MESKFNVGDVVSYKPHKNRTPDIYNEDDFVISEVTEIWLNHDKTEFLYFVKYNDMMLRENELKLLETVESKRK